MARRQITLSRESSRIVGELIFRRAAGADYTSLVLERLRGLVPLSIKLQKVAERQRRASSNGTVAAWTITRDEAMAGNLYLSCLLHVDKQLGVVNQRAVTDEERAACLDVWRALALRLTARPGRQRVQRDRAEDIISEHERHHDAETRTYAHRLKARLDRERAMCAEPIAEIPEALLNLLLR